jgi:hypothetical protein
MTQITFTASPFPLARLIRWVTKGRVSHAMLVYEDPQWGGRWVAEATVGGVKMLPAERALRHVVATYTCRFDTEPSLRMMRKHIGDGYDYAGLIFFGWAILVWRLLHRKIRRPWRNTTEEFCSEFVALFLKDVVRRGIIVNRLPVDTTRTTPEQLLKALEMSPTFEKVTTDMTVLG